MLQSTLLQLLIKELSPVSGSVVVDGKVSYASQDPWVFSGTLRDNVLFGLPYKPEWYQKVIEACSLDKVKENGGVVFVRSRLSRNSSKIWGGRQGFFFQLLSGGGGWG